MELHALGARVFVDTSCLTVEERDHLHHLWEWCLLDRDPVPSNPDIRLVRTREVGTGSPVQVVTDDWERLPYRLSGAVTLRALERRVGSDMLFHAAGLADEEGRVAVLVGPSGTGKTTAARELGTAFRYVSDESVAIDRGGRVAPYPKPLSLLLGTDRARKLEVSPAEAGLQPAPSRLRLGRLVMLAREPDLVGPPVVEELDVLDAAVRAAAQTSGLRQLTGALDWLARLLTNGGPPVVLRYREIADAAAAVRDLLTSQRPTDMTWIHHPPRESHHVTGTGWVRAPYLDAIEAEDRVLVLVPAGVVLLDGVGAQAWLAAAEGETRDGMLRAAVEALGPHPEAETLLDAAIHALERQGLLQAVAPPA